MKINKLAFAALPLLLTIVGFGQTPPKETPKFEKVTVKSKVTAKDFQDILAKLKAGETNVDYAKLRLAYTETKDYSPYGGTEARNKMYDAFGKKDDKESLKEAARIQETNYVDLASHFVSWKSNEALGNKDKADFHEAVYNGLMKAAMENDGLSEKTAIISIGISEQYFIMGAFGFERQSKSLVRNDGSIFDVHTALNSKTNETRKFYFNIDKVFGRF